MSDFDVRFRRTDGTWYIDAPGFRASTQSREIAWVVLEALLDASESLEISEPKKEMT